MVRWLRWHCPPDTGFEIRTLAVWGRARYLSVTEAPHNTNFHSWMGKKHFCFFQTAETGNRTPDSGVKGSGANHYPRAPAHLSLQSCVCLKLSIINMDFCIRLKVIKSPTFFFIFVYWLYYLKWINIVYVGLHNNINIYYIISAAIVILRQIKMKKFMKYHRVIS